jgi:hypothetical protein
LSLLDVFFRSRGDPTRLWTRRPNLHLEVALDRHSVCGVPLDQPVSCLLALGQATDSRRAAAGLLSYPDLGLSVGWDPADGTVEDFVVIFSSFPSVSPFVGSLTYEGRRLAWGVATREAQVVENLGSPTWRQECSEVPADVVTCYHRQGPLGPLEWQFAWGEQGLEDLVMSREHSPPPAS